MATTTATGKEAEIVLPPLSEKNPIPSHSAALRVDNQEQLLSLLMDQPDDVMSQNKRQYLVFGSPELRTLLMRQVLAHPRTRKWSNLHKSWDDDTFFLLPRGLNIAGTGILGEIQYEQLPAVDTVTYVLRPTDIANPAGH